METKLEQILAELSISVETKLFDDRAGSCKTFVIAKRNEAIDSPPVLLKSYSVTGAEIRCSIIQATRATCAAPTFFRPKSIELDEYIDGGIGYNNPSEEAVREVGRIPEWSSRRIGCFISVGTGKNVPIAGKSRTTKQFGRIMGSIVKFVASSAAEKLTVAEYCAELETSCEEAHRRLFDHNRLSKGRLRERYYRFNVDYGAVGVEIDE